MDIKKLTAGELAWLEEYTNRSITTFTDSERPQTKVMLGVVYLFEKRKNPGYTIQHAEALTLEQLNDHFAALADPPADPAAPASPIDLGEVPSTVGEG